MGLIFLMSIALRARQALCIKLYFNNIVSKPHLAIIFEKEATHEYVCE